MKENTVGKFKVLEIKNPEEIAKINQAVDEIDARLQKPMEFKREEYLKLIEDIKGMVEDFIVTDNSKYRTTKGKKPIVVNSVNRITIQFDIKEYDRMEGFEHYFNFNSLLLKKIINFLKDTYRGYRQDVVGEVMDEIGVDYPPVPPVLSKIIPYMGSDFADMDYDEDKKRPEKQWVKITFPKLKFADMKTGKPTKAFFVFLTGPDEGLHIKKKEGHDSNDVREATPILLAYQNLGTIPDYTNDLGLSEESVEAILQEHKDNENGVNRKKALLARYQGLAITDMLNSNKTYKIIRKIGLYNTLRTTGVEKYAKENKGQKLSPDNYNPADFFLIKQKSSLDKVQDLKLLDYNHLFANDMVKGGKIGKVNLNFPFIGVSQKESEQAGGGRAGEYFSVVKADAFGNLSKIKEVSSKDLEKETSKMLAKLKQAKDIIYLDTSNLSSFLIDTENTLAKYKIARSIYNVCTNGGKNEKVQEKYFLDLVKFSIAMVKELNPCYYKLIGGDISVMNPEYMKVDIATPEEKIQIKFSDNGEYVILTIPILFYISTPEKGEYTDHYQMKLPFEVHGDVFDPIVRNLKSAKRAEDKTLIKTLKKYEMLLKNIGISMNDIKELEDLKLMESWIPFFQKYVKYVYDWMIDQLNNGKVPESPHTKELEIAIADALQNIQTLRNLSAPKKRYDELVSAFDNLDGVDFDSKNQKYSFTKPSAVKQKTREIINKLDEYK